MKNISTIKKRRVLRKKKVRAKIFRGGINRPRLCVSKSNKHIFLQVIDDIKSATVTSLSDKEVKIKGKPRMEIAHEMGKKIAEKTIAVNIKKVVYDRGKYNYHGIIKAVAEGAREGGLEF